MGVVCSPFFLCGRWLISVSIWAWRREIDRSVRELEREKMKLEQQEKQLQIQIKKAAKDDEMESARMLAKDLVRCRQTRTKITRMKTQMQGAAMQLTTMTTTQVSHLSQFTFVTARPLWPSRRQTCMPGDTTAATR